MNQWKPYKSAGEVIAKIGKQKTPEKSKHYHLYQLALSAQDNKAPSVEPAENKPSDEAKQHNIKTLLSNLSNQNPRKELWERPLNENDQERFRNELRECIRANDKYLIKFMAREDEDGLSDQEIEDRIIKEKMAPLLKGESLGSIATEDDNWQSSESIVARKMLYSQYSDQIQNEKLKDQFIETTNWLLRYESSYAGGNYLTKKHLDNMVKVALPYILKNQNKIKSIKPEFKGNTGYYGIIVSPKIGNKIKIEGSGNIVNLNSNSFQSQGLFSTSELTESNIVLKISEQSS